MNIKRYICPEGTKSVRLSLVGLTLASAVALPFTAWAEDPEPPPIDPIWNRAKIEPERKKTVTNAATRATVGTSVHNKEEQAPTKKERQQREEEKQNKKENSNKKEKVSKETPKMALGEVEREELKVDIVKGADFPTYLKAAESGDTEGMRLVGICYLNGTGVGKDEKKAWEWFGKSASAGNAEAQYDLGCLYRDGQGVRQNFTESAYWFRRAARNGHAKAMINIARQFAEGKGVLQDYRIAAENFWRAAERGEPEGMYQYAVMLRDGIGIDQDKSKALRWFRAAAEKDYKDSRLQADELGKSVKSTTKPSGVTSQKTSKAASKGKKRR